MAPQHFPPMKRALAALAMTGEVRASVRKVWAVMNHRMRSERPSTDLVPLLLASSSIRSRARSLPNYDVHRFSDKLHSTAGEM
jgi:hypothetical protein